MNNKHHFYYIGFRESDIWNSNFFKGSITKYGSNTNTNRSYNELRLSPFKPLTNDVKNFFQTEMNKLIIANEYTKFVFYNQKDAYFFGEKIFEHSVGINSINHINLFSDKIFTRQYFTSIVPTPRSYILSSNFLYSETLNAIFDSSDDVVIQNSTGSGGMTTIVTSIKNLAFKDTKRDNYYLVSEYLSNTIPINVHILISNTIIIVFPPSIQIIKNKSLYYGADYRIQNTLDLKSMEKIFCYSKKIGEKLQFLGIRGVLGIDYILENEELYFIEINFRFQGSTMLLNKYLLENNMKTLQEYHIQSFCFDIDISPDIFYAKVPYANEIFFDGDVPNSNTEGQTILDGYSPNMKKDQNAYLYTILS